ncbi:hypothetical protein PFISCL1PPCAC_25341, partial [Pristionchus fissidentatus]
LLATLPNERRTVFLRRFRIFDQVCNSALCPVETLIPPMSRILCVMRRGKSVIGSAFTKKYDDLATTSKIFGNSSPKCCVNISSYGPIIIGQIS